MTVPSMIVILQMLTDNKKNYTDAEICKKALDYYEKLHNYRPSGANIDSRSNGQVVIQLYDNMGSHISTSDWYYINETTLVGTDFWGDKVDLNTV